MNRSLFFTLSGLVTLLLLVGCTTQPAVNPNENNVVDQNDDVVTPPVDGNLPNDDEVDVLDENENETPPELTDPLLNFPTPPSDENNDAPPIVVPADQNNDTPDANQNVPPVDANNNTSDVNAPAEPVSNEPPCELIPGCS